MTATPQFHRDLLRALQFLYYVDAESAVPDHHFDQLERAYETRTDEELPVGSDSVSSYTDAERYLAQYIRRRGCPVEIPADSP